MRLKVFEPVLIVGQEKFSNLDIRSGLFWSLKEEVFLKALFSTGSKLPWFRFKVNFKIISPTAL